MLSALCRGDAGPEADAARQEARATSRGAVAWDRLLEFDGERLASLEGSLATA